MFNQYYKSNSMVILHPVSGVIEAVIQENILYHCYNA